MDSREPYGGTSAAAKVFFAYPFEPEVLRETVVAGTELIRATGVADTLVWQDLVVAGRRIIRSITDEIDSSQVLAAEVTDLNRNVLFELGYAIGKDLRVWPIHDRTRESGRQWEDFGLLRALGVVGYANAVDIQTAFLKDMPHTTNSTAFSDLIEPSLKPSLGTGLFFLKALNDTEASRRLERRVDAENAAYKVVVADPTESAVQPLSWYAQSVYDASSVLVHLEGEGRKGARVHNARYSLIAGLAVGMGKNLLMVAESDFSSPIDYAELLLTYSSAAKLVHGVDDWLQKQASVRELAAPPAPKRLGVELADVRLGAHVAENEEEELGVYFVETTSYTAVLEPRTVIFVGRKGTGKTANLLRASAVLGGDRRNLVVVIKPAGYEIDALARLLRMYTERDERGYLVESLWKFLLFSEIARAAVADAESRPAGVQPETAMWRLRAFMQERPMLLTSEFAVRLEHAVERALMVPLSGSVSETRGRISEALHETVLQQLRDLIGPALAGKERVAILVDNLDKSWERLADYAYLSQVVLGLLGTIRPVAAELAKKDRWRIPVRTSLAVFLRSDIYDEVSLVAREPDKLPTTRITWSDREVLARVIEERFVASKPGASAATLWARFVCPDVDGRTTREYLLDRVLPRPRDLLFLVNAAITNALNRRHETVQPTDIKDAEVEYSQFALDSVKVETTLPYGEVEAVLYEFAGSTEVLSRDQTVSRIRRVIPDADRVAYVLDQLRALSFLGIETRPHRFSYSDSASDRARDDALARELAKGRSAQPRYSIHPAFRPYLEVIEGSP